MPIKFSELTTKGLEESSKIVGLYSDNSSGTGLSNCVIDAGDFAKQTALDTLNSEAVHIYGNEEIVGDKTFIGNVNINNNLTITKPVTVNSISSFNDKINGVKFSASNSTSETALPTIGWVNDPATSTNVVHRSGNESIAGQKEFTNLGSVIVLKNSNLEQMTNPTSYSEQIIYNGDKNGIRIGSYGSGITVDGNSRAYIAASKKIGDSYKYCVIDTYVDKNGNIWTAAPTPATNDNSTKIATTNYVNNRLAAGGGCFPNYASHSGRSQNTTYTASTNGFLYVHIVRSNTSEGTLPITIGGYTFTLRSNDYGHVFVWYPIAKGTVYTIGAQTKLSTVELTWFPAL